MRRYEGIFDLFFVLEHRMRREEMEEQFNKESKQGWRFAAEATRITDESAGSEDRKHTSGGVFVAINSNLGAVIDKEGVGKIDRVWVNARGGMRVFAVHFWHSVRWTSRNEAMMETVVK